MSKIRNKRKRFSHIATIADRNGTPEDRANHVEYYKQVEKDIARSMQWSINNYGVEHFEDMPQHAQNHFKNAYLTAALESAWYEDHCPCYKITNSVIDKILDIGLDIPRDIILPFNSTMFLFETNNNLELRHEKVQGLQIGYRPEGGYTILIYCKYNPEEHKGPVQNGPHDSSISSLSTHNLKQLYEQLESKEKVLVKFAIIASMICVNDILTEEEENKSFRYKPHGRPNSRLVTDIKYIDYRRFLELNCQHSNTENESVHIFHYQFTRKRHKRTVRYGKGRKFSREVWIEKTVVRPDLPRKTELVVENLKRDSHRN